VSKDDVRSVVGFGLACAFVGACFDIDEPGQSILFAFGVSWGLLGVSSHRSALVAQRIEQGSSKPEVAGSIPAERATKQGAV
jgi:hypothetical protein